MSPTDARADSDAETTSRHSSSTHLVRRLILNSHLKGTVTHGKTSPQ